VNVRFRESLRVHGKSLRKPSSRLARTLAGNVRRLRHQRGISQEKLADLAGLRRTYVGSVERGERNVTLSSLEVLASALGVGVTDLLAPVETDVTGSSRNADRFVSAVARSGLTIYDPIEVGHTDLWIPTRELEALLDQGLRVVSLARLPLRTRSKVVKERVCRSLGYPVPSSFKRTRPRFPGQAMDTYVQKSDNLQIWNDDIASARRYAIIRLSDDDVITRVKVVTGDTLTRFDTTGTLTQKYQARCVPGARTAERVARHDHAPVAHHRRRVL